MAWRQHVTKTILDSMMTISIRSYYIAAIKKIRVTPEYEAPFKTSGLLHFMSIFYVLISKKYKIKGMDSPHPHGAWYNDIYWCPCRTLDRI